MKLKIGIVGAGGFFVDDFINLFSLHPDVAELAVAELVPERRKAVAEKYHIQRAYASFEELLKNGKDLDSIVLFTQRHLHGPMIIQALKEGKNVFSAVPMACSVEENLEIVELVKKTRLIYMMAETCYYFPCAVLCRKLYRNGDLGRFVYGEAQYYHDISEMYPDYQRSGGANWRRVAGIPPMFYPTHSISMIVSVINEYAKKVCCLGYRDQGTDEIYGEGKNDWDNPFSNETALFQMSGGGIARINEFRRVGVTKPTSYISSLLGDKAGYENSVMQHTVRTHVTEDHPRSITYYDDIANSKTYVDAKNAGILDMNTDPVAEKYHYGYAKIHDVERLPKAFREYHDTVHYNSHPFLVDDFVRAVLSGKLPPNNAWESARYMIPGLIAHESALKDGLLMDIPDCGEPPKDWEKITFEIKDYYN